MGWHARLDLHYRLEAGRTIVRDAHTGPLRVLRSLYPEDGGVCHNVVVHPPGGIVGGDFLELAIDAGPGAHALVTTPGATRFYRSNGATAMQRIVMRVREGARVEWLPMETICRRGALAQSCVRFELDAGAEAMGWDVLALGLPASGENYDAGRYTQHIELPGVWLERATIDGSDTRLLDSPLGWAGHRTLATMWFAAGSAMPQSRRDALLDAARDVMLQHPLKATTGVTSTRPQVVIVRALAARVEPAMDLLAAVWRSWRVAGWNMQPCTPRIWRT